MSQLQPVREALYDLVERAIAFLPNLLTAVLLVLVGWGVGRFLSAGVRQLLRRLRFERAVDRAGWTEALARANIQAPPLEIVGRLVFWIVFAFFLVLAVENLGLGLTAVPLRAFVGYLPRVFGAVLLLLVGSTIAAVLGSAVGASLAKIRFEQHRLLASVVRWLVLVVTFMATVEHLGFDVTFLANTLTNLVTIFAAGLAITFALGGKEAARNILAGYYARERYHPGEILALPEGEGRLEGIGTLTSVVRVADGTLVVPNSRLLEATVRRVEGDRERPGGSAREDQS